jgi:hypothetical protein
VVAVWDALERTPGYLAMTHLLERLFGEEIAHELHAPYALGDVEALRRLFRAAEIPDFRVTRLEGEARFPSIAQWVHTDVRGWTLSDRLSDAQFEKLLTAASTELRDFADDAGRVRFRHDAIVVSAA